MKNKNKLSIVILLFFIITVFYPLLQMLVRVEWSSFGTLISSSSFKESLSNSIYITLIATILSVLIAYLLAFSLNRTNIKVISINSFYYHFSKLVRNKKLSIKEIDEIYGKIV